MTTDQQELRKALRTQHLGLISRAALHHIKATQQAELDRVLDAIDHTDFNLTSKAWT